MAGCLVWVQSSKTRYPASLWASAIAELTCGYCEIPRYILRAQYKREEEEEGNKTTRQVVVAASWGMTVEGLKGRDLLVPLTGRAAIGGKN